MIDEFIKDAIRKECKKTTQHDVASRAGISQPHVNRLLNGGKEVKKMSIDTLYRLFPNMKLTLHGEQPDIKLSSIDQKILNFCQELDDDTKLDVFRMLIENYSTKKPVRKSKAG
ncbi:MAG: helix-turn-helix transcriptional regulator [Lentisphaerota bacterium]